MADDKKKRNELTNISIFDVQLEQSKIVSEYPGSKSTLILWLKEFSEKLGILKQNQYMKNAKVYFSLSSIAPLTPLNFILLLNRIKKAYNNRIQLIKDFEKKNNSKIVLHSRITSNKTPR